MKEFKQHLIEKEIELHEDAITRAREKEQLKRKHDREIEREKDDIAQMKKQTQSEKTIKENPDVSLRKKAEKTGIPFGILKQVFNRGKAAWRTGHRPGTNPDQWGHARVNSFATKSKGTWGGADKDLAAKVRGKK